MVNGSLQQSPVSAKELCEVKQREKRLHHFYGFGGDKSIGLRFADHDVFPIFQ